MRAFSRNPALFALWLLGATLHAQARPESPPSAPAVGKRAFGFEDILAIKQVTDAQISPDGKWVAYVVTSADLKDNAFDADVWMVPAAGGEPLRLTTAKKSDAQPRWSPDGRTLAFVSSRRDTAQVYLISPFGGEALQLTESKTPVTSFRWSPDGKRIAFVAQQQPTSEEEQRKKDKDDAIVVDQDFKFSRIWVIDVDTRKARELVRSEFSANDPQWSPDGRRLAFTVVPTPKADDASLADIWIVEVDADSAQPRKLLENGGPDLAPRWSPDGRAIAFLTRPASAGLLGHTRLAIMSPDGVAHRLVAPDFLYQAGSPTWSADSRTLFFTAQVRTRSQLFAVPVSGGLPTQLSDVSGVIGSWSMPRTGTVVAFTSSSTQAPADVYVARDARRFAPVKLTDHNPQIRELALGAAEVVRWKSTDGMELDGIVYHPVGFERGRRYPTVVQVHGGPAGVWSESFPGTWGSFAHVWANRGWVVLQPNPRGSSGYGEKFLLANVRDWGGGDYRDIQSGIDHLVAQGIADTTKLAQTGWSYGGYMTAWTITQTDRFKAAMVGAGLTNMFSMYSTNDLQRTLEGYFGAEPWNDVDIYQKASAMTFIKRAKTPTLILHGQADLRVPIGQAQELYMGLRKNNVPAELVIFPREPHGLQEPRHQLDKMRREYAWLAKYVLGEGRLVP